ncbi:MAG: protein kinase domain-containing protein [Desulfobaccales bacterium]
MTSSRQDSEPLEELGQRYQMQHQLREEPWGEVWLAADRLLHIEVALKLYPRADPDWAEGQKILAREAVLSFVLRHPLILGVSFLGEAEDGLYLVEEPFDGESLMALLSQKQRLPVPQTLRLLEQVSQALAFAHQQGLAHQSLNPLHILLKGDEVRVANFACPPADGDKALHLELKAYTPPEVLHGEEVSPAGNIFSLGVLGYRMLAGSLPYPLTFDEPFPYRLETMPVDLEEIPLPLQNLLIQCLSPEPEDRFADAGAFLTQLRQLRDSWQTSGRETWFSEEPSASKKAWPRFGSGAAGILGKVWHTGKVWGEKLYSSLSGHSPRLALSSRHLRWGLGLAGILIILLVAGIQVKRYLAPPPEPATETAATAAPATGAVPPLAETEEPAAAAAEPAPAPAVRPGQGHPPLAAAPPPAAASRPEKPALKEDKYMLIVGTFPQLDQARTLARRLKAKKFQAYLAKTTVKGKPPSYQVRLGPFPEKKAAEETAKRLKAQEHLTPRLAKIKPKAAQAAVAPGASR